MGRYDEVGVSGVGREQSTYKQGASMIEVKSLAQELLPDLAALFDTSLETHGCWCMWFLILVAEYHASSPARNLELFGNQQL